MLPLAHHANGTAHTEVTDEPACPSETPSPLIMFCLAMATTCAPSQHFLQFLQTLPSISLVTP